MKHHTTTLITLTLVALLLGACVPAPASPSAPIASPTAAAWQTFTNAEVGFSIEMPPTWSQQTLPDQNNGAIHGMAFTGPAGGVEVYWGVGFGGACPSGTEPVQLAQGELPACHVTNSDGTETWSQIGYEVGGGNSFSVRAYTGNAEPSSHNLVLQVLATLTFMPPAQPQGGAAIANPASENCVKQGGTLEIRDETGGQVGYCIFADGSECEEWAFFRGECAPGKATAVPPAGTPAASATIQPLPTEVCNGQAQAMAHALDVIAATQSDAPISDPVTGASGTGCMATVTGTGEQFSSPDAVVKTLGAMLVEQGWTADPMLAAGGPNAIDEGYRKGDQICWAGAGWQADDSANCPKDQPVSACTVTPAQQNYTITLNCGVEASQRRAAAVGMANPASVNCTEQGGTLSIVTRGDGGQYGICTFADNRQCEEWALLRGDCPAGGVKVTGYVTPAATYCAITGGTYTATGNSGQADEQGACTFKDGAQCDAWDYYNGKCDASTATAAPATTTAAATTATAAVTTTIPLKDTVAGMDPQDVWQNFYQLTQIQRPSHHEEQVRDFLAQFGKDLGLETIVDDVGNVLIRKPASPDMEKRHGVILQAHMDMVAQPLDGTHDFLTEPIAAYVEGDWVKADGTTLGADDGMGVAIAMAILQSKTLALGPIEALFTVNEEDGMDGALGLQSDVLQGDILINLDSEKEGVFDIGSAGGDYVNVDGGYAEVATPAATAAYTVTVSGLQGGHSGVNINEGRGHATKLLVRLLSSAAGQYGVRLAQLAGGTAANAIPTSATALVIVPNDQTDAFLKYVQQYQGMVQSELAATEPDLQGAGDAGRAPSQSDG